MTTQLHGAREPRGAYGTNDPGESLDVGGNRSRAADVLGLNRGTLRKKLKTHGRLAD